MKRLFLPVLLSLAFAPTSQAVSYKIDADHTQVQFTYTHLGFSHLSARLNQASGRFDFDPAKPANSSIDVQLPMSSLSTGVPKLDSHLGSADFFEVSKFPTASFKSSKVTALGMNKLNVAGELTIHGVTRPVVFAVTVNNIGFHPLRKKPAAGFDATATIKRSDFGVAGLLPTVLDEVQLRISMEAQQEVPPPAAKKAG